MENKKTFVRKNGQLFEKMDILKYFFEDSEKEFHLRELARISRLAPSTVSTYINGLVKSEVIITRKSRGFRLFKSNTESAIYKDAKLFYNIFLIRNSGLIDYLIREFNHPKCIILFGSFRKSENTPKSDIDIFIETPAKKTPELSKFEKKLGHNIQLFQFSSKNIED